MRTKRVFDLVFSIGGLAFLSPLFLVLALWIRLDSPGPVFFRQERVGRLGKPFRIFKFRTMQADAETKGPRITAGEDPRVTRAGRFLRRHKLDELTQLINVARGEMSFVGPRPELPGYVAMYPEKVRALVLSVPPGITDYASIEYMDESGILAHSKDPDAAYVLEVMPDKLKYYQRYVEERSLWLDIKLILLTLKSMVR